VATVGPSTSSAVDPGGQAGANESFMVTASNPGGFSATSVPASAIMPAAANQQLYQVTLGLPLGGTAGFTNTDGLSLQHEYVLATSPEAAVYKAVGGTDTSDQSLYGGGLQPYPFPSSAYAIMNKAPVEDVEVPPANFGMNLNPDGSSSGWLGLEDETNFDPDDKDYNDLVRIVNAMPVDLKTLTVADDKNPSWNATATDLTPVSINIDETSDPVTHEAAGIIDLSATWVGAPAPSVTNWKIVDDATGATVADSDFGGITYAVLDTSEGDRDFTVTAGMDLNLNGDLDNSEIERTILVHVGSDPASNLGDQVGASTNRRVDIHGVPLPDPSPTGVGESDRIPNMAYVDAFSLTPTFSTTDVAVPMPGDELTMEFRRTEDIGSQITNLNPENPLVNAHWDSDQLLGQGWNTNINARIILTSDPGHQPDQPAYKATVYDDTGNSIDYFSNNGVGYAPDVRSSFSNLALRGTLATGVSYDGSTYSFCYTETHGTKLFYNVISSSIYRGGPDGQGPTEYYARLEKIVDRNGNEIDYAYGSDQTLVTRMYDPTTLIAGTSDYARQISFTYTGSGVATRLASVTDPLGHEYDYEYNGDGLLTSVVKPPVADPTQPDGSPLVRPSVQFTYDAVTEPRLVYKSSGGDPWDSKQMITWVMPATITDARGTVTSFQYAFRVVPTVIESENFHLTELFESKPRLVSATTPDGTAYFNEVSRTIGSAVTQSVDTRGITTTYTFTGSVVPAPNDLGFAIVFTQFTRSVPVTDIDGNTQTETATFNYSADIDQDLTSVTDLSGNTVQYNYNSGDSTDPFNATPYGSYYGTDYAIFGEPSAMIMDPGTGHLNLTTQYRYDTTFNKLIEQIDPEGKITQYALDANGNRIQETDAAGTAVQAVSTFTYNSHGFMTSTTDPDGRETDYLPNSLGNLQYTVVKGLVASSEDLTPLATSSPFPTIDPSHQWIVSERVSDAMNNTLANIDQRQRDRLHLRQLEPCHRDHAAAGGRPGPQLDSWRWAAYHHADQGLLRLQLEPGQGSR
jgi:YD repeat-containing protein